MVHFIGLLVTFGKIVAEMSDNLTINVSEPQHTVLLDAPTVIHMCGIIESGSGDLIADYRKIAPAIEIGLADANAILLPEGYKIIFHFKDAGPRCSPRNDAFRRIMEYMTENTTCHVYLGPSCDDSAADVHSVAVKQDVPVLACPAANIQDTTGQTRQSYTHLVRNAFFYTEICDHILNFLWRANYTDIAIMIDPSNSFFNGLGNRMRSFIRGNLKPYTRNLRPRFYFVRSDTSDVVQKINESLHEINVTARVTVLFGPAMFTRNVLISAINLKMANGEYVYVAVELYQSSVWGHLEWEQHDDNDRLAKEGMKSLFLFSLYEASDVTSNNFENIVRELSRTKFAHLYKYAAFENVDPVATSFYELTIFYASAVKSLVERGINVLNETMELLRAMHNVSYPSPRGENITMDVDGDRYLTYVLKEFNLDSEEFETRLLLSQSKPLKDITGQFHMPCASGGYDCPLPPNMPICGFDGRLCRPEAAAVTPGAAAAIAICTLICLALIIGYLIHRESTREKDPFWWRIPIDDVTFSSKAKSIISLRRSQRSLDDSDGASEPRKSMNSGVDIALTATYNQNAVSLTTLPENEFRVTKKLIVELKVAHSLRHQNVQKIVGVVINSVEICLYIAGEACTRGSLDDVLENESIKLDWAFKYSLMKDIAEGMTYLHSSSVVSHGFLSAVTCLVDSRFVVKISEYGVPELHSDSTYQPPTPNDFSESQDMRSYLWRAPELLRMVPKMPPKGTQKGHHEFLPDFSHNFAILLQQITLRNGPFEEEVEPDVIATKIFGIDIKEVVQQVQQGLQPPKRPVVSQTACRSELRSLMFKCWAEEPSDRPAFTKIKDTIKKIAGSAGENVIDHLIEQMEQYAADLEKKVAAQTQQFMEEKEKTEELLCQLLPKTIAAALTRGETVDPEQYDMVSIYYSDIVGFTTISAQGTAMDVVALLNSLYSLFDSIIENYDAYKVETIGDAYMIASGLPNRNGDSHGIAIASTALDIVRALNDFKILHIPDKKLQVRIGLNCGSCVAGIVGIQMPRYCLFGDTVTITQRLEWSGEPMKIQISTPMKDLLQRTGKFKIRERGMTNLKDQGVLMTHWLDSLG